MGNFFAVPYETETAHINPPSVRPAHTAVAYAAIAFSSRLKSKSGGTNKTALPAPSYLAWPPIVRPRCKTEGS